MTPWPAWLRFGLLLPLVGVNAFVLKAVLVEFAPFPGLFLTSALIAFLLDLPCRWLMGRGLSRAGSIALVMLLTVGLLGLAAVALLPLLIEQLSQLINASPSLLAAAERWIDQGQTWAVAHGLPDDFADLSSDLVTKLSRVVTQLSQRLLGILGATVGTTINVVIVLVLAVFLLLGADSITAGLVRWLPERWRDRISTTLERTFRGYFAGQVLLALILSAGQLLVFGLLAIPYGVLFAVLIGLTTLIPYASALTIVFVSAVLGVQDPRTGIELLAAAIVVGQIVDQVIQPRLMGSIVGLQPAWLLIALPIGARVGALFGLGELLGLLLAVPVASCIKTLADAVRSDLMQSESPPVPEEL
ncbi:MAG: AI-2E family transporter [Cyanobium sp. NAT70]|nr:AI-2E family transporter [Cyanobium sp. NAT70]MAR07242.1 AI-2E family transporter [Cyanobium sp. NAT70]|tara:strand:+ start:914 stop:1990 length:1077 start_codon:yes stop_codon:yes gene_type:complete